MGRGLVLDGQPTPPTQPKGAGFQRSPILGIPSIHTCIRHLSHSYQISHGKIYGLCRWSFTPPSQRISVLHLCLHLLTQNDQSRHGNTYGEGRGFRRYQHRRTCTNASGGLSAIAEFLV